MIFQVISLTSLKLHFYGCSQLADVSALGISVGNLQALKWLELTFGGSSQLADVSALGTAVGKLQALTSLVLDYSRRLREMDI